ncbi:MAG: hypothetical protein AAF985_25160, partial [Bacteroidota bacterium]
MTSQKANENGFSQDILPKIIEKIEQELNWGRSEHWTGSDFEKLSDLIAEKTGQSLSVSTLKRLWGRTSQAVQPTATTLNILAEFTGAKSWRAFDSPKETFTHDEHLDKKKHFSLRKVSLFTAAFLLLVLALFSLSGTNKNMDGQAKNAIDPVQVSFSLEKVARGIPNT